MLCGFNVNMHLSERCKTNGINIVREFGMLEPAEAQSEVCAGGKHESPRSNRRMFS